MMLVMFSEALGAGQTFADKHHYRLDPNQEMSAIGVANVGSGLLGGLAAGGSLSQSAVNDGAGAKTELSSGVILGIRGWGSRSDTRRPMRCVGSRGRGCHRCP
jgi:MFS superfamily sulfate permease-like transporter